METAKELAQMILTNVVIFVLFFLYQFLSLGEKSIQYDAQFNMFTYNRMRIIICSHLFLPFALMDR